MTSRASIFWLTGGLTALVAAIFAVRKSGQTSDALKEALRGGTSPSGTGGGSNSSGGRPIVAIHATGYWPYAASASEKTMEGGTKDRKGRPIHTLEQHLSDPVNHPYVSVAGDYEIWPDGQRISLSPWPTAIFRVVDTGGHFHGTNKVFRVIGEEPLDIAVNSSATPVPKKGVTATIFTGDNFDKGATVATSKFRDQKVT